MTNLLMNKQYQHGDITSLQHVDFVLTPFTFQTKYLTLKKGNWLLTFQTITKEQFLTDVQFNLDLDEAVIQVVEAFQLSYSQALTLVKTLLTIPTNQLTKEPSLALLHRIYVWLEQKDLLKKNPLARVKYEGKTILVDGYDPEDGQLNSLFHQYKMQVMHPQTLAIPTRMPVYEFASVEDEVTSFYNRVAALIKQGVSLANIYVLEPDDVYTYELHRQSMYFQIPIQLRKKETLYALPIFQIYLRHVEAGKSHEAALESLSAYPQADFQLLKQTLSSVPFKRIPASMLVSFLIERFQQTQVKEPRFLRAIQVVRQLAPSKQDHVFVLGFLQGQYPQTVRDKGFLSDEIKTALGLLTTTHVQQWHVHLLGQTFAQTENLVISMPRLLQGKETIPSPLIHIWNMDVQYGNYLANGIDYSQGLGQLRKVKYEYLAKQFKAIHPYLHAYQQRFHEPIQMFDYAFSPLDADFELKPLKLSYSALKDYFQCSFKYYVGRILKVKPMDQDEFYMHLGTFAHEVFETIGDNVDQFDQVFEAAFQNQVNLSDKEKVLFSHLKQQIYRVCVFNQLHRQSMQSPSSVAELKVEYVHDEQTSLVGYIDKIVMVRNESGQEYLAVVDYKSGGESFEEKLLPYGWSLQLPIYALMLENHPEFKGKEILGLFIQHIIESSLLAKTIEIGSETFPKSYQLDGIVLADKSKIAMLDRSIQIGKSSFLEGVSMAKSGEFKKTNHVKTASEMKAFAQQAKTKITEAAHGIRHGAFHINPKSIDGKSSCEHCPFLDTCFRASKDVAMIRTPKKKAGEPDVELD